MRSSARAGERIGRTGGSKHVIDVSNSLCSTLGSPVSAAEAAQDQHLAGSADDEHHRASSIAVQLRGVHQGNSHCRAAVHPREHLPVQGHGTERDPADGFDCAIEMCMPRSAWKGRDA